MTKEEKLALMERRRSIMMGRGDKNIKAGGVLRKLNRQIRNMK